MRVVQCMDQEDLAVREELVHKIGVDGELDESSFETLCCSDTLSEIDSMQMNRFVRGDRRDGGRRAQVRDGDGHHPQREAP